MNAKVPFDDHTNVVSLRPKGSEPAGLLPRLLALSCLGGWFQYRISAVVTLGHISLCLSDRISLTQ